ncbi:MAG: hypothetical protein NVS2B16_27250 [Chloroflexota bacterium]
MAGLVLESAHLYVDFRRLTLTGSRSAAWNLINALGSSEENVRTIAGMFLVRAGQRSLPEVLDAIDKRHAELPTLLIILADIGGEEAREVLMRFASDPDEDTAHAATDGLTTIEMR